jgi:hypothetical protein
MRRNRLLLGFVTVVATTSLVVACSSDDDDPTYTFKDASGRTCSRTRSGVTATCDTPSTKTCTGGSTACYTATLGSDTGPDGKQLSGRSVFKVCASCCSGNTSSSTSADCAVVVCATDADCAAQGGTTCGNGRCQTN